jgi:hypothetical protein
MCLVALGGCRKTITEVPRSFAQVGVFGDAADYPGLRVVVEAGSISLDLGMEDLLPNPVGFQSTNFLVPDFGEMVVMVSLRSGDQTIAAGEARVTLRPLFQWGIRVVRQETDPHAGSLCTEPAVRIEIAEPFRRGPDDLLWLSVSGPIQGSGC